LRKVIADHDRSAPDECFPLVRPSFAQSHE
jgi:hypothetical protein